MSNNEETFRHRLILTLIDKLGIAAIILLIGFFANRALNKQEHNNTKLIEEYKSKLEYSIQQSNHSFLLQKDSLNDIMEMRRAELNNLYIEQREELQRREEQNHQRRLEEIKSENKYKVELLKFQSGLTSQWIDKSMQVISEAWELINQINIDTELLEDSLFIINEEINNQLKIDLETLDIIYSTKVNKHARKKQFLLHLYSNGNLFTPNLNANLDSLKEKINYNHSSLPDDSFLRYVEKHIFDEWSLYLSNNISKNILYRNNFPNKVETDSLLRIFFIPFLNTSYSKYHTNEFNYILLCYLSLPHDKVSILPQGLEEKYMDNIEEHYNQNENIKKKYREKFIKRISIEKKFIVDDTENAINYINSNRFWIGETQRSKMISFLNSINEFYFNIPNQNTREDIQVLLNELNSQRNDFYKFKDQIFKGLL